MSNPTPGQKFIQDQLTYFGTGDLEGLVQNHYTENALLITPFEVNAPPPQLIRGRAALLEFFRAYIQWHGAINVESLYNIAEAENVISFQAVFTSNQGRWFVGDGWHLVDGKIDVHYSYSYKLG